MKPKKVIRLFALPSLLRAATRNFSPDSLNIDENFSKSEEVIIKQALLQIGASNENLEKIFSDGKKIEENSNQILLFTKEVKSMSDEKKIQIIEALWQIIYSNEEADMYETSLMRRLGCLLYIDSKTMGAIKDKVKKEFA